MKTLLLIINIVLGYHAIAQEIVQEDKISSSQSLEEVVVSATRTQRAIKTLPIPTTVITQQELKNTNTNRLSDILNEQTGIITVPDFGGGEGIQMQGMDAAYTLLLIDGTPLIGRSAGTLDLNRITVGNVKQIEIVKGPSSGLYGSDALGGVINIITETPKQGFHGNVAYRYGSFNTQDANLNLQYKHQKITLDAFLNRYESAGYDLQNDDALRTIDPFTNYTVHTKITYDTSEKTNVLFSGRYYWQQQENIASATLAGESTLQEWNTRLKINHTFSKQWNAIIDGYITRYNAKEYLDDREDNSLSSRNHFDQFLALPELRITYTPHQKHKFSMGTGWRYETLDRTSFSTQPVFNSQYAYIQYDGHLTKKLVAIAGLRFDHHEAYASQWSPKLALHYALTKKIALKSSIGYGFKAPDFRQLYFDFTNTTVGYTVLGHQVVSKQLALLQNQGVLTRIIVPASAHTDVLKAENSIGINIGIDYTPIKTLTLSLNGFRNSIKDLIDTRVIATKTNGQNVFSYYNINNVYTTGLEFSFSYTPLQNIAITGGYQLLYAKDKTAVREFKDGNVFARDANTLQTFALNKTDYFGLYNRSRHMSNLKITYTQPNWKFNTNIRTSYRSKYGISDSNSNGYLDQYDTFVKGYMIWDWAMQKTILNNYTLAVGIDNIGDFTDGENISNIPGRIIYGKCTIQL